MNANLFRATNNAALFSDAFKVGDAVTVEGSTVGLEDARHALITAIDDETNTLTFAPGTFHAAQYLCAPEVNRSEPIPGGAVCQIRIRDADGTTIYKLSFTPLKTMCVP